MGTDEVRKRLEWQVTVALEKPSNYGRRVTVAIPDLVALISALDDAEHLKEVER